MKRFIFFTLLMSFSLIIGCSSDRAKGDILITQAAHEDVEFDVLQLLADQLALWELSIDQAAEEIEVLVEHYEFGEKQEPLAQMSTILDDENSRKELSLLIAEQLYNENSKWTIAFISEDGISSSESTTPTMDEFSFSAYATAPMPLTGEMNEEIALATIMFTNSDEPIVTSTALDEDFDEVQLENYDHTYIVKLIVN